MNKLITGVHPIKLQGFKVKLMNVSCTVVTCYTTTTGMHCIIITMMMMIVQQWRNAPYYLMLTENA